MKIRIKIEKDEAGYFVVEVPAMPGCMSQGRTQKEAIKNVHEAIDGWIEVMESKVKNGKARLVEVRV